MYVLVFYSENSKAVNTCNKGAALLAFLYHGLDNKKKNSQDGNLWVLSVRHNCSASFVNCYLIIIYHFNIYFLVFILQCFFCFRIPELSKSVGYDIPSVNLQAPLLMNYMEKLQRVSKNHRTGYQQKIERLLTTLESKVSGSFYISLLKYIHYPLYINYLHYPPPPPPPFYFNSLYKQDITWHPYVNVILDDSMKVELEYVTRLTPVICMNHVAYHQSLDLRKQFKVLAKYADMPILKQWNPKRIRHKQFKGSSNQDFIAIYKKQ